MFLPDLSSDGFLSQVLFLAKVCIDHYHVAQVVVRAFGFLELLLVVVELLICVLLGSLVSQVGCHLCLSDCRTGRSSQVRRLNHALACERGNSRTRMPWSLFNAIIDGVMGRILRHHSVPA